MRGVASPAMPETEVVLRDGSTVAIRPAQADDESAIRAFLERLSPDSRYLRFHSGAANLDAAAREWAQPPGADYVSLIAIAGPQRDVVGHASLARIGPDRGEVAFAIADQLHGHGLGTHLLGLLAEIGNEAGITTFEADVLPQNGLMLEVFRESGFPARVRSEPGWVSVELATSLSPEARERFEQREQIAAANAVRALLAPRSIAVVGASRNRHTVGGDLFHNLVEGDFAGPVYPVNPNATSVQAVRAYPSILDVPGSVDMAVVVVPAASAIDVARDCARKGVRGLVVISAGFAETGAEGAARQAELVSACREAGMRLIGPNCMGVINTAADVRMNAQFAPIAPLAGRVAFLSQSGAVGLALIDHANRLGLGLSTFVSVGNKADLSGNDFLSFWEGDPQTAVILLYLESLGNPRRFARIARRVGRSKPIIAVKSGRSTAGSRATSSHTGALLQASDMTVDALFRQAGVIRTDTLAELFDVASLLANQPAPAGRRVAILTNGGGPGILAADACESAGLEVPRLAESVQLRLADWLPAEASVDNPVDMIASATAADYGRAIGDIAADDGIDAVIAIFAPPLATRAEDVAGAIRAAAAAMPRAIPVASVFMSAREAPAELRGEKASVPAYTYPEDAVHAMARAAAYGQWRATPEGTVPDLPGMRREDAAAIIALGLARGPSDWLGPSEVASLLGCYGLPMPDQRLAETPEQAVEATRELGSAVALKAVAPGVIHKTDLGGVRLGLAQPSAVKSAAREMAEAYRIAGHPVSGFLVQRMAEPGIEMLIGVVHDSVFGPVVACGAGGTQAELLKDLSVRITPLTDRDAAEMVRSLATFPLLDGYRGTPKSDVAGLEELLLRVSAMVEAHSEIVEMDLNPVVVTPRGVTIVDARVRVAAAGPQAARFLPGKG